jgi:sialate O-acetylesterase
MLLLTIRFCLLTALLLLPAAAKADVKLPALLGDHMVLQRGRSVPVWGKAAPGEKVVVKFAGQTLNAVADGKGDWSVKLAPLVVGEPQDLQVIAGNRVTVRNVVVGDVWLCAGQSNMGLTVAQANNAKQTIAAANNSSIRLFRVGRLIASEPSQDTRGSWSVCSSKSVADFSAAGYYFGRKINQALKVPVGLIDCSFGGTPIDAWVSRPVLEPLFNYRKELAKWDKIVADYPQVKRAYVEKLVDWREQERAAKAAGRPPTPPPQAPPALAMMGRPASLFNGMIAPLVPFAVRGVIWNQGEADIGLAPKYRVLFPAMISDWRKRWLGGDCPFYFVQLHNFVLPGQQSGRSHLAELREAQTAALGLSHTGMIVALDMGGSDLSIHYTNKQGVGDRLAEAVLSAEFGSGKAACSPTFDSATVESDKICLRFKHADGGLAGKGGQVLNGFAVAGPDGRFTAANAVVNADTVMVSSPSVPRPTFVRYAWADNPNGNLVNGLGLPAAPFRTDNLAR